MTREEALKILRGTHDKALFSVRNALETLIPELTESEDERIRKELIEALKTSKTVGELKFILPEPTRKECIAYLEKQKEQKPADGLKEAAEKYADGPECSWVGISALEVAFIAGAEWQKDKILKLIELHISEIIGDAQPNPVLRIELQSIIDKIK